MLKHIKSLTLVFISVLFVQCAAKKTTTSSAPSAADIVADVKKNFTEAQMEQGSTVFQSKCKKCHDLKTPETRTVAKWERVLPRMSKKAQLSEEEANNVRAYVLAHAKL